ncbi:hypothetical protein Taro_003129 [Colocasia esculenta]|uniref:Uncharacterized protein n=1 Tax=Colocasia esculenta TaxID=4460 RepID=A0A843TNA1_COLES|nr:hypothetical protein [Colocasia esculenta]
MADAFSSLTLSPPQLRALHIGGHHGELCLRLHSRCHLLPLPSRHLIPAAAGRKRTVAVGPKPFPSCSCSLGTPTATRAQKRPPPGKPSSPRTPVVSEGRDEDEALLVCPGCGIIMQDADPNLPGYYQKREARGEVPEDFSGDLDVLDEQDFDGFSEEEEVEGDGSSSKSDLDEDFPTDGDMEDDAFMGSVPDWDMEDLEEDEEEEERRTKELEGFAAAGVGYGNITGETLRKLKKEKLSKSEKKRKAREEARKAKDCADATVCARCHSLRNYGQVKNHEAENLIPDFDFDRLIATRLMKPSSTSPVVVMVVDTVDFDASFPKRAARSLFKALEGNKSKLARLPKLVLVATKVDLLPSQISPTRLDRWVRNRAKASGAPKLSAVYLVSSRKDLGVRNLLSFIKELAGPRGNVWVIGAQNAGKSTLINTFAKKEGAEITRLTEAAVPGTTLGILRIGGILPAKAKLYDTPGLLHPYLMPMRLNREEQKMVEIRKELQPRTYRVKAGQTIHVGGLTRLDVTQSSVDTIYVTVWASPSVSLHLGKTENAEEIWKNHVGVRLQPPAGQDRASELGQWKQREVKISGISWEVNSLDIAVAGLGWFSLGLKGEATLMLWTYDGVEITQREPLVLDRAPFLERPGFLLPKAISDALRKQSKLQAEARKSKNEEVDPLSAPSL